MIQLFQRHAAADAVGRAPTTAPPRPDGPCELCEQRHRAIVLSLSTRGPAPCLGRPHDGPGPSRALPGAAGGRACVRPAAGRTMPRAAPVASGAPARGEGPIRARSPVMARPSAFPKALAILVLLAACPAVAAPVLTGDAEKDFNPLADKRVNVIPVTDAPVQVAQTPWMAANGWVSGWNIKDIRTSYDPKADALYVGVNFFGIAGDAYGSGN